MSLTLSGSGTIGGLVAGGLPDATITSAELASNAVNSQTLTLLNASGSAPVYACRAWVNFNGTGTVAIRASGNVSSITDNGTGKYAVNFLTALPDANYATVVTNEETGTEAHSSNTNAVEQTASIAYVSSALSGAPVPNYDSEQINVAVFR